MGHGMSRRVVALCALWGAAGMCWAAPSAAWAADPARELAVSAKLGANWSVLNQPEDPRGEPTLLSGSAFDGAGFTGGATGHYYLGEFKGAAFELEGGLLYSFQRGEGFEGVANSAAKRTLTLSTHVLRIPLMVFLKTSQAPDGFRVGAGLVPTLGIQSAATVVIENSDQPVEPLQTYPALHLGLSAALGYDIPIDAQMSIPLEVHAVWDPFVAKTTRERFDDFKSLQDPGKYQVAFDWQFFFMTGLRYEL